QARELGRAWERLPQKPHRQVTFKIVSEKGVEKTVLLGAHAPDMTEEDLRVLHDIWLQVSSIPSRQKIRHRDVVRVALNRLRRDLRGQTDVMLDFYRVEHEGKQGNNYTNQSEGEPQQEKTYSNRKG